MPLFQVGQIPGNALEFIERVSRNFASSSQVIWSALHDRSFSQENSTTCKSILHTEVVKRKADNLCCSFLVPEKYLDALKTDWISAAVKGQNGMIIVRFTCQCI